MGATSVALAVAAIGAAGSAYSAHESASAAKKANVPKPADAPEPVAADTSSFRTSQQDAQRLAQTAGGTITNPGSQNGTGDAGIAPRKTLLGS